jgi:hypothetical protein
MCEISDPHVIEVQTTLSVYPRVSEGARVYQLIQSVRVPDLLVQQAPPFAVSLVVAETLYKFHSFTLECLTFLATWYVLDAAGQFVRGRLTRAKE